MRFKRFIKAKILVAAVAASALLFQASAFAITPGSIPYSGDDTQGADFAAFNIFHGVPSVGNEADFIRVKKDGEANSALRNSVDTTCKTGDRFDVWFYVHNGAKESTNNGGTGPGVAKNVVARVNLPQGEASSFNITGGVTSSNAQAINDNATINCGGEQFKLKFVNNSAQAFLDFPNKLVSLPDAIVSGGTPIGTHALNGSVEGCWEQRVWMNLKVEVEKVVVPPPVAATCDLLTVVADRNRKATITDLRFTATNANVKNIVVNWGDGTTVTRSSVNEVEGLMHQFSGNGPFTISATMTFSVAGRPDVTSGGPGTACAQQVVFREDQQPPVVTPAGAQPTQLVNVGPGSAAAVFGAVTAAGALAHRWMLGRRLGEE